MREVWKVIETFDNYQVSNMGRVKSKKKILKPFPTRDGYLLVVLFRAGERYPKQVHRLVALAFIPNPMSLPEVNHKEGNKEDNRYFMLEWRTRQGNMQDAGRTGLKGDGIRYAKDRKQWRAGYSPSPRHYVNLGSFDTYEEAVEARQKALKEMLRIL